MIDPVAFTIFGISIRWYGLAYVATFLSGKFLLEYYVKYTETFKKEHIPSLMNWIALGVIIGGRIGHFLFFEPKLLFSYELFKIRNGGMSFHGGIIGVTIAIIIFSKINKINKFEIGDLVTLSVPIGSLLGRISNLINQEIQGNNLFGMYHHVTLYEAFSEGLILFIILLMNFKKNICKPGKNTALFLIYYSVFRFICEFFKDCDFFSVHYAIFFIVSIVLMIIGLKIFYDNKSYFQKATFFGFNLIIQLLFYVLHKNNYINITITNGQILSLITFSIGIVLFHRINKKIAY